MLSINTNLSSLIVQGNLQKSTDSLNQAIERMTTGYKINHASDNAANFSISTNMDTKIGAYMVAEENASMGIDMVTTAAENLNLVREHLSRLRDLAEQAANGTYSQKSLDAIQAEVNARTSEINRIVGTTKYNGVELFKGEPEKASKFIKKVERRDTSTITSLESVDEEAVLAKGTYSISTAKELAKLATMQNNGKITDNSEFVLAADIDLSEYTDWVSIGTFYECFCGTFDGNGYVISNLNGDTTGLFGRLSILTVKNLGVENINIATNGDAGGIVESTERSSFENCYTTGNILTEGPAAGFIADGDHSSFVNCFSEVNLSSSGGWSIAGGLMARSGYDLSIINCYTTGNIFSKEIAGGLVGSCNLGCTIENSYSTGNITSSCVGGLVGSSSRNGEYIKNSYATGDINCIEQFSGDNCAGGIIGNVGNGSTYGLSKIENCYYSGTITAEGNTVIGGIIGELNYSSAPVVDNCYYKQENNELVDGVGKLHSSYTNPIDINKISENEIKSLIEAVPVAMAPTPKIVYQATKFQVGSNASESSQINLNLSFELTVKDIDMTTSEKAREALSYIDSLIKKINEKFVEYGAAENRLMSVLEEISVQYDNLVSARSTIKDADMAEISSQYIQQQILQQASATLLATANQTPALALQLL